MRTRIYYKKHIKNKTNLAYYECLYGGDITLREKKVALGFVFMYNTHTQVYKNTKLYIPTYHRAHHNILDSRLVYPCALNRFNTLSISVVFILVTVKDKATSS